MVLTDVDDVSVHWRSGPDGAGQERLKGRRGNVLYQ